MNVKSYTLVQIIQRLFISFDLMHTASIAWTKERQLAIKY